MNWLIPGTEILYGIFTLLQFRATSFEELMAYRFFVGFFEVYIPYIYDTCSLVLLLELIRLYLLSYRLLISSEYTTFLDLGVSICTYLPMFYAFSRRKG